MITQIEKYTPDSVLIIGYGYLPVIRVSSYPPFQHPEKCPIKDELTALELRTEKEADFME